MSTITKTPDIRYHYGVGRRKAAVARAKFYPTGTDINIQVNKTPLKEYFQDYYSKIIEEAITKMGITSGTFHFFINGGGIMGQAEAARLALAKAMIVSDPELKPGIRALKYNSTDIRKVLSKRPGKRKARKSEQWSKR